MSPAVKWVEISTKKSVMYTSQPGNLRFDNEPGSIHGMNEEDDYGDI